MSVLVSIIIPVYNAQKYLNDCLDSVLGQTYESLEVICVDDGSTDDSGVILDNRAKQDARLKVIYQTNQGISVARNRACSMATGDYIMFVDSDDLLAIDTIKICMQRMLSGEVSVVCFDYKRVSDDFRLCEIETDTRMYETSVRIEHPLYHCLNRGKHPIHITVWGKLFHRDVLKNVTFIEGIKYEDYPYILSIFAKKIPVDVIEGQFYFYRDNPNSVMHKKLSADDVGDYENGLFYLIDFFRSHTGSQEFLYLKRRVIPNIIKQLFNAISKRAGDDTNSTLLRFAQLLIGLQTRNCLHWRGHKLTRYWKYKKLMKASL